jgi:2',3'-cyclic-nucleotide 2'-phosphodiesterase (5'-nucleotidase family)
LLLAASGCEGDKRPPAAARPHATAPARPNLRLVALTDVSGYLEPCGCQSRPLGGVDKGAQVLRELSADGVPSVVLTAGDLFFEAPHGGHGASDDAEARTEHIWRAETLADALKQLGLAASEAGVADARYGADTLAALALARATDACDRARRREAGRLWSQRSGRRGSGRARQAAHGGAAQ